MINKEILEGFYIKKRLSAKEISIILKCSETKIHYWLSKHKFKKRSISEAVYVKANPTGDPFSFSKPTNNMEWFLYGLGIGLYWGEGNKLNKQAVRLGNTDPDLIRKFLEFLHTFYSIDVKRLRFGIQVFSDCNPVVAKNFWVQRLGVSESQFHKKVIVTKSTKPGTYVIKNKYGVLTVYFSNTKLRDMIVGAIEELRYKPS